MRSGPTRIIVCALALVAATALPAAADDPANTAIIYVHGFELEGFAKDGVFGEDAPASLAESLAERAGRPVARGGRDPLPPGVIAGTRYYGDIPPPYYTEEDLYELDRTTWEYGGGVPRYAFIVARHARDVMERSGARQVSFVSASFGSLVVRWLIENNVCGLAGERAIARWLSIEGVIAGNWAASHHEFMKLLDVFAPLPVDLKHMSYDWVEAHIHRPRAEAASPYYAGILMGQVASTDDGGPGNPLRAGMLLYNDYKPNDQVQAMTDAVFLNTTGPARFMGLPPTRSVFHTSHRGIRNHPGAWAQAATFLTGMRRVTVTMTSAWTMTLPDADNWYWSWLPAEILFETWAFSPAAEARYGPVGSLSTHVKEGASAPLRRFSRMDELQPFHHVVFDDLVLPEETQLVLRLWANEVDFDPRYGVFETTRTPHHDDMGGGWLTVSTLETRNYSFSTPNWGCHLEVRSFDYPPTKPLASVPRGRLDAAPELTALRIRHETGFSSVRIAAPGFGADGAHEAATLEVLDVSGRLVRRMRGELREEFAWDGRDADGRAVQPGIYFYRVAAPRGTWTGRSFLLR